MPGPILNFNGWNKINESSQKLRFDQIYEAGPTPEDIELATKYRVWANSTPELAKKWGSTSVYKLSLTWNPPYTEAFKKSYDAGGKDEFEKSQIYIDWKKGVKNNEDSVLNVSPDPDNTNWKLKINDAVNAAIKKKADEKREDQPYIFAYFWKSDSADHQKFTNSVLKSDAFKKWSNGVILYSAQLANSPEQAKNMSNLKEYEELSKLFSVSSVPVVKIIKAKQVSKDKNTYEVVLTKSFKGEDAQTWINPISEIIGSSRVMSKSENYTDAQYAEVSKKMEVVLSDKWKKKVKVMVNGVEKEKEEDVEGLSKLVYDYLELKDSNPKLKTSIDGLNQTLIGLKSSLKLSCDLKYREFWTKKGKYLKNLIETEESKNFKQSEIVLIKDIINRLNEINSLCNDVDVMKRTGSDSDQGVDRNLQGIEVKGERKYSRLDNEIVRSGKNDEEKEKLKEENKEKINRLREEIKFLKIDLEKEKNRERRNELRSTISKKEEQIDNLEGNSKWEKQERRKKKANWIMNNIVNRN